MLEVRFFADYVRFGPKSGRIDTVTVESAGDPLRTLRTKPFGIPFGCALTVRNSHGAGFLIAKSA